MRPDYFEGILQLRKPTRKILQFVIESIENAPGVWVAKQEKVRGGIDLYMSSNQFLKNFAASLAKKFCGELKITYTLHTKKEGKDVYRMTVLFKPSPFREQDIIDYKGEQYKVMKVRQKVELKDMKTGKRKLIKFDDIEKDFRKASIS